MFRSLIAPATLKACAARISATLYYLEANHLRMSSAQAEQMRLLLYFESQISFAMANGVEVAKLGEWERTIGDLRTQLTQEQPPLPTEEELEKELLLLNKDSNVEWCSTTQQLRILSPNITLQEVKLGQFYLHLHVHYNSYAQVMPIALTPNWAKAREDVPHPHIDRGALCLGEGRDAYVAAMHDGRICDAVNILLAILGTYNPSSAYVKLEDWQGVNCSECNEILSEPYLCEACGTHLCESCGRGGDDYIYCCECSFHCEQCDCSYLNKYRNACEHCGRVMCNDCFGTGEHECSKLPWGESSPLAQEDEDPEETEEEEPEHAVDF